MLVVIGATLGGREELIGFEVAVREIAQSRRELLIDVKTRGLSTRSTLARA
jgi:transposase-like protein